MIKATCVNRYRDNSGNIVGYCLVAGNVPKDFNPDELKSLIKRNKIKVDNLSLTRDNKLIMKSEKDIETKSDIDMNIMGPKSLSGFFTDEGDMYNEVLPSGALLRVSSIYWDVKFQPDKVVKIGVYVSEGWSVEGTSIDRCIKELNKAYDMISKNTSLKQPKEIEEELSYGIKVYSRSSFIGHQIWLMGSNKWIKSRTQLDAVIRDLEYSKFRMLEIREQMGWNKSGFLGKIFGF